MIREATLADLPGIERMWLAMTAEMQASDARFSLAEDALMRWRNDAPHWVTTAGHGIWVVDAADQIVGFADAELWQPPPMYVDELVAFINHLYVVPAGRGEGHGRALFQRVQAWAASKHCSHLRWRTLVANKTGCAFWQAVGGTPYTETWRYAIVAHPEKSDTEKPARPLGFH